MTERAILHADLDAFFASVEQRDNPGLRGKPVVVGGSAGRGVVAAASYEARKFGIRSAMPMAHALRLCPNVIVVSHHMSAYSEASQSFLAILRSFSPDVEQVSVDEAFVDVTGVQLLFGNATEIATKIRERVRDEMKLTVSVGCAPTKFVAKIASDINKPNGLCVVTKDEVQTFLRPLPVSRLWGVGPVTQKLLGEMGLRTIGDVEASSVEVLRRKLGTRQGDHLAQLAQGIDPRKVECQGSVASIGNEETFQVDVSDRTFLENALLGQGEQVARRLRGQELMANTVILKLTFADFRKITRRRKLVEATDDGREIVDCAKALLREVPVDDANDKRHRVRLCGISVTHLVAKDAPRQLQLSHKQRPDNHAVDSVLDRICDRFGTQALLRGRTKAKERW